MKPLFIRSLVFVCCFISLTVFSLQQLSADEFNWPGIRGAEWNGISNESGTMDAWPEQGPPVLWTRQLGQGYSACIAWGDRIATQYQSLSGQYVICMDANTGQTLWEHRYEWSYDPAGVYPGPRATSTYFDGCVYFANSNAGTLASAEFDPGTHGTRTTAFD